MPYKTTMSAVDDVKRVVKHGSSSFGKYATHGNDLYFLKAIGAGGSEVPLFAFSFIADEMLSEKDLPKGVFQALERLMPLLMDRLEEGKGDLPIIKILTDTFHVVDPSKSWKDQATPEQRRQTFRVVH